MIIFNETFGTYSPRAGVPVFVSPLILLLFLAITVFVSLRCFSSLKARLPAVILALVLTAYTWMLGFLFIGQAI